MSSRAPNAGNEPLATRPFVLLCLATTLGYANYWVLLPVIPLYVQDLGGSAFVAGVVLLAFSVPSVVVRPAMGRIADKWSAGGVLAVGLVALALGTLPLLVPTLVLLFVGNAARGLGWAGVNTGSYTALAIVAPAARRGEAAGYFNSSLMTTSIVFPALGLWLVGRPGGLRDALLVAALLALLGLPFALGLAKKHREADGTPAGKDEASGSWIERRVLLATGLNLCTALVAPALIAFLPLYARSLGVANLEWYYVTAGITSVVLQPFLGRKSDAIGHGPAIGLGLLAQLVGLVLVILAQDIVLMTIGGFFAAIGGALISSMTTALAMVVADPKFRGRAMATYSMSWQIGAGLGSLLSGALADLTGLRGMYVGCVVITLVGLVLIATAWKTLPRPEKRPELR